MCYSDGGDRDTGIWHRCDDFDHFDCGHDDYFDSAPEPGEYLATHWNLGWPLNRFLLLGRGAEYTIPGAEDPGDRRAKTIVAGHRVSFALRRSHRRLFKIEIPAGMAVVKATLRARSCLTACSKRLGLALRQGALPTSSESDCRATYGNPRWCAYREPGADWWYVAVRGPRGKRSLSLSVSLG